MKTKMGKRTLNIRILILISIFVVVLIVLTIEMNESSNDKVESPNQSDFIVYVFPQPNGQISLKEYKNELEETLKLEQKGVPILYSSGIVVCFDIEKIDEAYKPDDNEYLSYKPKKIFDRVALFIDKEIVDVPVDGVLAIDLLYVHEKEFSENDKDLKIREIRPVGIQSVGWAIVPEIGVHEARFQIISNTGKTYEYVWSFEVVP